MMKIAQIIVLSRLAGAGAERHVLDLSCGLQERGCEVILLCHSSQTFMFEAAERKKVQAIPVHIGKRKPWQEPLAFLQLTKILQREKIDPIATHLARATLWGGYAGKIARIPVVSTVHAPRNAHRSYQRAQMQIAISGAVREAILSRGFSQEKVKVVYNGIDTQRFSPVGNGQEAKRLLDLPRDALILGIGAHLSLHKDMPGRWNRWRHFSKFIPNCTGFSWALVRSAVRSRHWQRGFKSLHGRISLTFSKM